MYSAEETYGTVRDRNRLRWTAAGLALGLHLAILILFVSGHPALTAGDGVGAGAMDVSLAGLSKGSALPPAAAAPPTPPSPPTPAPADAIKPRSVIQIVSGILAIPLQEHSVTPQPLVATPTVAQTAAPVSGSPGAACDIGEAVQTMLRSDPETHAAIVLIPRQERSVANAVLLWNGQWVAPAGVGGATAFATIKTSIRQIVATASPGCREQEIVGPRFMLIPAGTEMIVAVVGNASWRWSDILVDPQPALQESAKASFKNIF
jgi:hypothetical protein